MLATFVKILLLLTLLNFANAKPQVQHTGSKDFDFLIFTQHWPQTVCFQWKENDPHHDCSLPENEEWTIHGIWPTQMHEIGPAYCNHSWHFNVTLLGPILPELQAKWVDVENGTKPYSFWKHEWEKHGTCAAVLEPVNSEVKYFQKGLELLDKFDMKHVLTQGRIQAGETWKINDYLEAVKKVTGKTCQIECIKNPQTKTSYLFEIRICFDKSFNLIDCDGVQGFPTNCDHTEDIYYPSETPSAYQVIQL